MVADLRVDCGHAGPHDDFPGLAEVGGQKEEVVLDNAQRSKGGCDR